MKTEILHPFDFTKAKIAIQKGELVAFPTETVYGLGANAFDSKAISKIFSAKKRPQDNPLIVHVADFEQMALVIQEIPDDVKSLMRHFLPGPLTVLLPKKEELPSQVTAGSCWVAVRMPAHPVARKFLQEVQTPLVAPSANLSGRPSCTDALAVWEDLKGKIAYIIDGGVCGGGIESTIIQVQKNKVFILRPGLISKEQLEKFLDKEVCYSQKITVPGMKYRHYAPCIPVYLNEQLPEKKLEEHAYYTTYPYEGFSHIHAANLYQEMRLCEKKGKKAIYIYYDASCSLALLNRLQKASANG